MKTFIVFAAIVACAFASPLYHNDDLEDDVPLDKNGLAALLREQGGLVPMLEGRIVGGVAVTIEQFPWSVTMRHNGGHRCGGSIISTTRILSAAHCTVGVGAGDHFLLISNHNKLTSNFLLK